MADKTKRNGSGSEKKDHDGQRNRMIAERVLIRVLENDINIYENRDIVKLLSGYNILDEIPDDSFDAFETIIDFIYSMDAGKRMDTQQTGNPNA